jgi:hypothetical protein
MSKILHTIAALALTTTAVFAQIGPPPTPYPYFEDFESSAFPTTGGSMSFANWTQTASETFSTYSGHGGGTPASKGLTKNLNTFTTSDTITAIPIGPLTATSQLSFDYRVVEYSGATATTIPILGSGFKISFIGILITLAGDISVPITTITTANHVGALTFASKTIALPTQAVGYTGVIRIVVERGAVTGNQSADYFVDIDNIRVGNASTVGLGSIANNSGLNIINDSPNKSIKLVSTTAISDVVIYAIDGKQVFNEKVYASNQNIDFNSNGIYIVQCTVNGVIERKKIVIE